MGARAARRAGIEDPGDGPEVFRQLVAVPVDDDARERKAQAQQAVTIARRHLMSMDQHQGTARQWLLQPLGQVDEQTPILLRPFAGDVVVAEHRQHPSQPGLELGQDGGVTDIAAMHRDVAAGHDLLDARIKRAMGVGQQGDPHLCHGRDSVQLDLGRFTRFQSIVKASLPVT